MVSEEWAFFNVWDKPEAETFILNVMLQNMAKKEGFNLEALCYQERLTRAETEAVKRWQAHGRKPNYNIIKHLITHLEIMQASEYDRALQIYYNYIYSFQLNQDVAKEQIT